MGSEIEDPFVERAFEILKSNPTLGKARKEGCVLATNTNETSPAVASIELISILSNGETLDQSSLSELIICLDLLTSGLPDNATRYFDPDIQNIGGKLRQRYSKLYGGSPYQKTSN